MSVYEITLLLNGEEQSKDIVEYNGQQYRKVKRKAAVGELVVVTDIIDDEMRDTTIGKVYKVVTDQLIAFDYPFVNVIDDVGDEASVDQRGYSVLELVEQSGQSELDLIAHLAQEVAELKRQLSEHKAAVAHRGCTLEMKVDQAHRKVIGLDESNDVLIDRVNDLEDRVDENEKEIERMNDLGDGAKVAAVDFDVVIDTLLAGRKDVLEMYTEVSPGTQLRSYYGGKSDGITVAIDLIKEALRNG